MGKHHPIQCNFCDKYMRSDNLKRHLSQHKNKSKYPISRCYICNKSMIAWHFKRHLKTHSNSMKSMTEDIRSNQIKYAEKEELGRIVKKVLETEEINPKSLSKQSIEALEAYSARTFSDTVYALNVWQNDLMELMKPSHREVIWVTGQTGGEGKSWVQGYIECHYGSKRVFRSSINKNSESIFHALSKRTLELIDIFVFNIPRSFKIKKTPYNLFEDMKDGCTISTKYNSELLNFKTPNIIVVFANEKPDCTQMSNDRWVLLNLLKHNNNFVLRREDQSFDRSFKSW